MVVVFIMVFILFVGVMVMSNNTEESPTPNTTENSDTDDIKIIIDLSNKIWYHEGVIEGLYESKSIVNYLTTYIDDITVDGLNKKIKYHHDEIDELRLRIKDFE